jgi:uncharacterized protein YecT (DUF1311 family)
MIVVRLLVASLVLGLFAGPATAASFDCAQASTPFEDAICDTPDLSRADEILAKAFATAVGGLSKPSADAMREGQRNWLAYAQRVCTADAKPLDRGRYNEQGATCLVGKFNERIDDLEQSRMLDGHRFLITSAYATIPDPDEVANADSYYKLAAHELVLPQLDSDDPIAEQFNAFVMQEAGVGSDLMAVLEKGDTSELDPRIDNSVKFDIKETGGANRITLVQDSYYFGHGAAHGGAIVTYLHYLVKQDRALEASDIFAGADWEKTLVDLAWAQVQAEHGEWMMISSGDDIAAMVVDPTRWDFSDVYGLVIQFNQYEISAYAYGTPTITIPWNKLEAIAAENQGSMLYGQ